MQFVQRSKSKPIRTLREFAEQEIVLPNDGGPFSEQKFRVDRQPFIRLLWEEMESSHWTEALVTGCVQSGKTLMAFVIPICYILFELMKNPLAAIPDGTMIKDKWNVDLHPVLKENPRFEEQLPKDGPGSKGGAPKEYVKFDSGQQLKFMTKGGSDQSKAGYTAPYIVVTEAAGWSKGTETSTESAPIDQIRGRQMSVSQYDDEGNVSAESMLIVEGTITDETQLPYSEYESTSKSRVVCPCPHCKTYVTPEREHLKGWQSCKTESEAAKKSHFVCPACQVKLSLGDRIEMNQLAVLIHDGQTIDKDGAIRGERPPVAKLWFRWNAFNNLLRKPADYGVMEWRAAQIADDDPQKESKEKQLCQQVWVIPYTPKLLRMSRLNQRVIRKKQSKITRGVLPEDTEYLVAGIDVGKWTCWYIFFAFTSRGIVHIPQFGALNTSILKKDQTTKEHENLAIASCLNEIYDICDAGFPINNGGGNKQCDLVVPDTGYRPLAVFSSLEGRDEKRYLAIRGQGKTVWSEDEGGNKIYIPPTKLGGEVIEIGETAPWHIEYSKRYFAYKFVVDADYSKSVFQGCLRVGDGLPGSVSFFQTTEQELSGISRHFCAELKDANGNWVKRGQNHLLDCAGYAWMSGNKLGWDLEAFRHIESNSSAPKSESWFEKAVNNGS